MAPKLIKKDSETPASQGGGVKTTSASGTDSSFFVSDSPLAPRVEISAAPFDQEVMVQMIISSLEPRFAKLDSKIEAIALLTTPKMPSTFANQALGGGESAEFFDSPVELHSRMRTDHRPNRQSLGSYQSHSSQEVVNIVKSSFRLDKPKFEFPPDLKNDGAFDESVLKFINDCERHIEIWCALPENKNKDFEGSEVFALVTLPAQVQKRVAHNLDMIYEKSEISGWTLDQIQQAKKWSRASTAEVKQTILERRAKGIAKKEAVKTIQPPAIAWPNGAGFIHLDAFEEYKSKMTTQISRLSAGGVSLSFISIKDAIISAIPDRDFKGELYTQFGHVGSLPGPTASGVFEEFSVKSIFDFIRAHIVCIKQKGLTETVNKNSGFFVSTPQTQRKFGGYRSFSGGQPHSRVQAVDFHSEFPEPDREFWAGKESEQSADEGDEYSQVNTAVQAAKSKECRFQGIGPDGKVLCPYLGKPETARCGFLHPAKELELRGKGVSKSTPAQPKKVHNAMGGLGVQYADDAEPGDCEGSDF